MEHISEEIVWKPFFHRWFISDPYYKAYNFQVPRLSTNTFAYSAIKDWNNLSNHIKDIKSEQSYKENVKKFLRTAAKELESSDFVFF